MNGNIRPGGGGKRGGRERGGRIGSWRDLKMFLWVIMVSHAKALRGYIASPTKFIYRLHYWNHINICG